MSFVLEHLHRPSSLKANAPLLLMCHGYGSDENDLFSFASELPEELFIISVKAPYPLQPYGNAWYAINFDAEQGKWSDNEQAKSSRDLIATFIKEACEVYPIDNNNISLLGFSQGCILSLAVALSYPELIKNVIGLSGYVNADIIKEDFQSKDLNHLQVFSSHGTLDQVIPVDWARQTPKFLDSLQVRNVFKEYPVGHGVAPQNFFDFKSWLQKRI